MNFVENFPNKGVFRVWLSASIIWAVLLFGLGLEMPKTMAKAQVGSVYAKMRSYCRSEDPDTFRACLIARKNRLEECRGTGHKYVASCDAALKRRAIAPWYAAFVFLFLVGPPVSAYAAIRLAPLYVNWIKSGFNEKI